MVFYQSHGPINGSGLIQNLEISDGSESQKEQHAPLSRLIDLLDCMGQQAEFNHFWSPVPACLKKPSDSASNTFLETSHDEPDSSGPQSFHRFLDLPPEIRDQIYQLALGIPTVPPTTALILKSMQLTSFKPSEYTFPLPTLDPSSIPTAFQVISPPQLNILATSKQVYAEAFRHFYSNHLLTFTCTSSLLRFLRAIGPRRRNQLTRLFIHYRGSEAKPAFRLLSTCVNLTALTLTLPCIQAPGYFALREVRGLSEVNVCAIVHCESPILSDNFFPAVENELGERWRRGKMGLYLEWQYKCRCRHFRSYLWRHVDKEGLVEAMMRPRLRGRSGESLDGVAIGKRKQNEGGIEKAES